MNAARVQGEQIADDIGFDDGGEQHVKRNAVDGRRVQVPHAGQVHAAIDDEPAGLHGGDDVERGLAPGLDIMDEVVFDEIEIFAPGQGLAQTQLVLGKKDVSAGQGNGDGGGGLGELLG